MIRAGFSIHNPYAQSQIVLLPSAAMEAGSGWLMEIRRPPGSGPDNTEHAHRTWSETFEIVEGVAEYKLNGQIRRLEAGQTIHMPPQQPHIHPWNAGEGELVYRQSASFAPPDARALQEVFGGLATVADLARQGKLSQHGQPRNLLQMAVTLKLALKYGRYDARAPAWLQSLIAATLGSLGALLGYQAIDPRYRS